MIKKLFTIFISLFIIISLFSFNVSAAEPIEYFLGDGSMSSNCYYYNSAGEAVVVVNDDDILFHTVWLICLCITVFLPFLWHLL